MSRPVAGLLAVAVLGAACGAGRAAPAHKKAQTPVGTISSDALPATLDGLSVQPESDKSVLANTAGTYAAAVGFWSLRQKRLVEGTLEVVKLTDTTPRTSGFRASLVNQITGGVPSAIRLSGHDVYLATGIGSGTSTWFDGDYLYILTTRSQFATPRTLLEAALAVHIA